MGAGGDQTALHRLPGESRGRGEAGKPPLDCGQSPAGWCLRPGCQESTWQGEIEPMTYTAAEAVANSTGRLSPSGVTEASSKGGPG